MWNLFKKVLTTQSRNDIIYISNEKEVMDMPKKKLTATDTRLIIKSLVNYIEDTYGEVSEFKEFMKDNTLEDYKKVREDFFRFCSNI